MFQETRKQVNKKEVTHHKRRRTTIGSLKQLKVKMLAINPDLPINNDEYIISALITARRFSKGVSEIELASTLGINIEKIYAIEEGEVTLDDSDYQKVLTALNISKAEIEELLRENKL